MYQAVLFDMDGTVLDTLADITESVNHTLLEMGYPARKREEIRAFLGYGSMALMRKALGGDADEETVQKAFTLYRAWYAGHAQIKTAPYDGIVEMLRRLKSEGVRVAVASNKPEGTVKKLCAEHFPGLVDVSVGDVDERRRKPCPDMIDAALKALGTDRTGAVYVGDTEVDVQTAENSGLPCICVGWGFRSKEEQIAAGGALFAATAEELEKLLLG